MKLIKTDLYLLLIDEEAEINFDTDYIHAPDTSLFTGLEIGKIKKADAELATKRVGMCFIKVIAYYPLTKEAKELDLPLLPNPFEEEPLMKQASELRKLRGYHKDSHYSFCGGFIEGYKAAQSKQFSLEDMKDILEEGLNWFGNGRDKEIRDSETWFNHYIQSLSTQRLPKEFVGWLSKKKCPYNFTSRCKIDSCDCEFVFETIINSEGKKEIQGKYVY